MIILRPLLVSSSANAGDPNNYYPLPLEKATHSVIPHLMWDPDNYSYNLQANSYFLKPNKWRYRGIFSLLPLEKGDTEGFINKFPIKGGLIQDLYKLFTNSLFTIII